ncbi:hypothetical protein VUR80DRAFT_7018 [Thermomyces stellatus]
MRRIPRQEQDFTGATAWYTRNVPAEGLFSRRKGEREVPVTVSYRAVALLDCDQCFRITHLRQEKLRDSGLLRVECIRVVHAQLHTQHLRCLEAGASGSGGPRRDIQPIDGGFLESGVMVYKWIYEQNNYGLVSCHRGRVDQDVVIADVFDGSTRGGTPTSRQPDFDNRKRDGRIVFSATHQSRI